MKVQVSQKESVWHEAYKIGTKPDILLYLISIHSDFKKIISEEDLEYDSPEEQWRRFISFCEEYKFFRSDHWDEWDRTFFLKGNFVTNPKILREVSQTNRRTSSSPKIRNLQIKSPKQI